MSSSDERTLTPPPVNVHAKGGVVLSLDECFGQTSRKAIRKQLDILDRQHLEFVTEELGIQAESRFARNLRWKRRSTPGDSLDEYELVMDGDLLPEELRGGAMAVRIQVSDSWLRLTHNFRVQSQQNDAAAQRQRVEQGIQTAVVQAFNPLVAVTLQQEIKQKANQILRQEQRLLRVSHQQRQKQEQLQTVVVQRQPALLQTIGTILSPR